jgi:hypothetical protein
MNSHHPQPHRGECFICARRKLVKTKRFHVLYYLMEESICLRCWLIPTCEPKIGHVW